ncbi:hypothetical protein QCA50_016711 [Cerrena zonata]|uniref:Uncharacterized protein n=1 Tax=Cerrena zonata TaxID=2478898 RepID=A0AAW0FSC1_9APHY
MYAHGASNSAHIPQPPHSAGMSYKGLRAAIDPHQIPSPIEVFEADQEKWDNQTFMTLPGTHPPLSTSEYVAVDQGNSSPRYIRLTTWNFPSSSRLANECAIPLAAIIQPFADQDPSEEPVPVVETGESGPARCSKCRGYINPWCTWVANGARWKCNLCEAETEVDSDYYSPLDANLMRLDHAQRPELNKGTVDFKVPSAYWAQDPQPRIKPLYTSPVQSPPSTPSLTATFSAKSISTTVDPHRPPKPMDFVFLVEVTYDAVSKGFVRSTCENILRTLYGDDEAGTPASLPLGSRICIITFDGTIQFYNLASYLDLPQMLVVSDIDDPFLPTVEGIFVNPQESRSQIEKLLTSLSQRDQHTPTLEVVSCLGSALTGALAALSSPSHSSPEKSSSGGGGLIITFATSLPTLGLGALTPRPDDSNLHDTDNESELFAVRNEVWQEIGETCAEEGVGVCLFLGPGAWMDIGTIGVIPSTTGGDMYFHPKFDPVRDGSILQSQLHRVLSRTTAYSAIMKIRTSYGVKVNSYHGTFQATSLSDELTFGTLSADKALSVSLQHVRTLDERQYVHIQVATLYTSVDGERRVRTCNVAVQVAALAGSVFRFADMDAVVGHVIREAVGNLGAQRISYIQEELTEKCSSILLGYRKNCAASTSPSQLIIPEAFRAYPVYTLAMFKSKPLKGRYVSSDMRNYWIHKLLSMSTRSIMHHLYPRMMAIHDLNETIALPLPLTNPQNEDETGDAVKIKIDMPSLMRDSHIFMAGHGVYVIDDEETIMFWIGASVSPRLLQDLFGVDDINNIDRTTHQLPHLPTLLSTQVRNILAHRKVERGGRLPRFMIARQNMDGTEIEFSDMLIEDQNNAALSYLDYLCLVHKQINIALTTGGSLPGSSSFRNSPW